jgi:hypothetical protein
MKNRQYLINTLRDIEIRLNLLQDRSYSLENNSSELRQINKRRKKLDKDKEKILRKLEQLNSNQEYNDLD